MTSHKIRTDSTLALVRLPRSARIASQVRLYAVLGGGGLGNAATRVVATVSLLTLFGEMP